MNYFILPKLNTQIIIKITIDNNKPSPYLCDSLLHFSLIIENQLNTLNSEVIEELKSKLINELNNEIYDINKINNFLLNDFNIYNIINPYHYLFNKIPNYFYIKNSYINNKENDIDCYLYKNPYLNPDIHILQEIINTFRLLDTRYNNTSEMKLGFYNNDKNNTVNLIKYFKILYNDNHKLNYTFNKIDKLMVDKYVINNRNNIDFLYYKINKCEEYYNTQLIELLKILYNILCNQSENGVAVLNISNIIYRPNIEFIFILSIFFEKIIIIKPQSCDIFTDERYIVCKNFIKNEEDNVYLNKLYLIIVDLYNTIILTQHNELYIQSILEYDVPLYFLNKIEEINVILGQQKLDLIYQNINTLKANKNKIEKLEIMKKNNISKCIKWYIKNDIAYNKKYDNLM